MATPFKEKTQRAIAISLHLDESNGTPRVGWSVRRIKTSNPRREPEFFAVASCPAFRGVVIRDRISLRRLLVQIWPAQEPSWLWIGPPQWWTAYPLTREALSHAALTILHDAELAVYGKQKTIEELETTDESNPNPNLWRPEGAASTTRSVAREENHNL